MIFCCNTKGKQIGYTFQTSLLDFSEIRWKVSICHYLLSYYFVSSIFDSQMNFEFEFVPLFVEISPIGLANFWWYPFFQNWFSQIPRNYDSKNSVIVFLAGQLAKSRNIFLSVTQPPVIQTIWGPKRQPIMKRGWKTKNSITISDRSWRNFTDFLTQIT